MENTIQSLRDRDDNIKKEMEDIVNQMDKLENKMLEMTMERRSIQSEILEILQGVDK